MASGKLQLATKYTTQYATPRGICHIPNTALFTYNFFLCIIENYLVYNLENPIHSKYIVTLTGQKW